MDGGVEEVARRDPAPGNVDDVDRGETRSAARRQPERLGRHGLGTTRGNEQRAADGGDQHPTVCTSHHSRLGPVIASKARRDRNGRMPVAMK